MKMSKKQGLEMLQILDFPTIELIDHNLLDENSSVLKQGLSVRTSPKTDKENNVYLPSIHNCKNLSEIREFIKKNQSQYNILVHRTLKTEQIGSISRYVGEQDKVIIEIFQDFEKRKEGIIKNRAIVPIMGEKFRIDQLELKEKNAEEYKVFSEVIRDVKYMPFQKFDAEFVVEKGKIVFTDLTILERKDQKYAEELRKQTQEKKKERSEEIEK